MPQKKHEKVRKAYQFFLDHIGQSFSIDKIAESIGWKVATVRTYINKKWQEFVELEKETSLYRILDISSLTETEFINHHSQITKPFGESVPANTTYLYEVALSFAGEDREYVDKVAKILKSMDITVFYDMFERDELWGKNLYEYLDDIYRRKCKYCVMFVSKHYAQKMWTKHERKSAQARAFEENQEYILPAKFDDTEIPGLLPTIGFLDLRNSSPLETARIIAKKLNRFEETDTVLHIVKNFFGESYEIKQKDTTVSFLCIDPMVVEGFYTELSVATLLSLYRDGCLENFLMSGYIPI